MEDHDLSKFSPEDLEKAQQVIKKANDISYFIKDSIAKMDFEKLTPEELERLFEIGEDVRQMHRDYEQRKKDLEDKRQSSKNE
ncbi:hypothetical protein [uncultured Microscilla sp.]|uniref:hypothetical protein n=1 Tax=uncultured Microscilla sp. TaxID=432653 RepID=UPI00260B5688|nr:hypothetical protein [uncultured Microscilla sp.]